ncbi:MAG: hypothetical protein V4764_06275 [Burkholderia sp.]
MKWLAGLLIVLIGTAVVAARSPDDDTQIVLAAGYGATIVIGLMAGRLLWARAARNRR